MVALLSEHVLVFILTPSCLKFNAKPPTEAGKTLGHGSFFYGVSVLYCMTTSLVGHGEGLGTVGPPESKVQEICLEAGSSSIRHLLRENPFNNVYEVKPQQCHIIHDMISKRRLRCTEQSHVFDSNQVWKARSSSKCMHSR